jgi:hypothetical protein
LPVLHGSEFDEQLDEIMLGVAVVPVVALPAKNVIGTLSAAAGKPCGVVSVPNDAGVPRFAAVAVLLFT